jgi:hypothetical protein
MRITIYIDPKLGTLASPGSEKRRPPFPHLHNRYSLRNRRI